MKKRGRRIAVATWVVSGSWKRGQDTSAINNPYTVGQNSSWNCGWHSSRNAISRPGCSRSWSLDLSFYFRDR